MREGLEEDFEPAVVIPRQRRHDAFLANFTPIMLVEKVPDAGENPNSPIPKSVFCGQVPNVVGGDEALEGVAIVPKLVAHGRAKKRELQDLLVAIDRSGLDLILRSVRWRVAGIRSGGEFGVQQRDVAEEQKFAVRAGSATVDQRQTVQFSRGFKPDITRVADVGGGSKSVR